MDRIPFDTQRFLTGDVAFSSKGEERFCKTVEGRIFAIDNHGAFRASELKTMLEDYTMKPTDDGQDWIQHSGGPCPIPRAKPHDDILESTELSQEWLTKVLTSLNIGKAAPGIIEHKPSLLPTITTFIYDKMYEELSKAREEVGGVEASLEVGKAAPLMVEQMEKASKSVEQQPYRSPSITNALYGFRFDAEVEGPIVECPLIARLMR